VKEPKKQISVTTTIDTVIVKLGQPYTNTQHPEHSWDGYVRYTKLLISFFISFQFSFSPAKRGHLGHIAIIVLSRQVSSL
jgi:hypothetical protein